MDRVHITRGDQLRLNKEIGKEAKRLYRNRYGKRNPNTLSTQELDDVKTEAGKRIQDRRKGRLVE